MYLLTRTFKAPSCSPAKTLREARNATLTRNATPPSRSLTSSDARALS